MSPYRLLKAGSRTSQPRCNVSRVLNKNLENLVFFAAFGRSSNWAAGAAVAVGMGKPAFCAGFQAPRCGVGTRHERTINPPSERHFHSETLDFQGFVARLCRF